MNAAAPSLDPLRNPLDPMHRSGPAVELELFRALTAACNGYPSQVAVGAAANLIVNAVRQQHPNRRDAEEAMREVLTRTMTLLLDQHYDLQGNRRNVFPFHQIVQLPSIEPNARPRR